MRKTLAACALLALMSGNAVSQDSMPGSVFAVPDAEAPTYEALEDQEVETDMALFVARGFTPVDWDAHSRLASEVARDVAIPDYVARTGKPVPEMANIEVASAMITKGPFNDLLVLSRLPGDCDENGCLFQIYVMKDEKWSKAFEFKATGMAWKDRPGGDTTVIAAVGDEEVPSRTILWDGERFLAD